MNIRITLFLSAIVLAGCATQSGDAGSNKTSDKMSRMEKSAASHVISNASTLDGYKRDVAQHISQNNSAKVYSGHPQALLRSVIVLKYVVDAHGNLLKSAVVRSNHDRETEATALATLRNSAPFPQPATHLLRQGRIEISETWLFNDDGRFQLRTIAQPQMDS